MSCGGCEQTVEDALQRVEGVDAAEADRDTETATVQGGASPDELVKAVQDAGYDASP